MFFKPYITLIFLYFQKMKWMVKKRLVKFKKKKLDNYFDLVF